MNLEIHSDNSFRIILNEVQKYPICTNWVKEIEVGFQICFWFKCYFCRDYRRIKWRNDLTNGWHANAFSEPWHAAKWTHSCVENDFQLSARVNKLVFVKTRWHKLIKSLKLGSREIRTKSMMKSRCYYSEKIFEIFKFRHFWAKNFNLQPGRTLKIIFIASKIKITLVFANDFS